ncbi:MAG: sporulation protein [Oscillospiraceae bacterium]|nr:sporulation protein [Oscillospiraceae bacterium]
MGITRRQKTKQGIALVLALGLLAALLLTAGEAADACRKALVVCGRLIIPSLFPFFVLSSLLNSLGLPGILGKALAPFAMRLYGVSGAGASALLIGLTGGYPAGAGYIADMERNGAISRSEGERLLAFCNNAGPAFIIGTVGVGVFQSTRAGLLLYVVLIVSALLTGLFFRNRSYVTELAPVQLDSADSAAALSEAVRRSVGAVLNVCGFVLCFSVLLAVLDARGFISLLCGFLSAKLGWELHAVHALTTGLFELGSGAGAMQGLPLAPETLALAAFLLGWGGISVYFQTQSVLAGSKLKGTLHITGRLLCASIAAMLAYGTGLLFL